jgi:tetratricopeptide (TPR) repeat protein
MTELTVLPLVIPGAPLGGENPLPYFRDPQVDRKVDAVGLPTGKSQYLGWQTGFRVLPYRMQDQYSRQRQPIEFQSIVLENEILKAVFLPQLGGRLISLFHKPYAKELLHRNPVFQPANLAIRNAWFSGGIEWNCGQYGHSFTTCSPIFAAKITGAQGEPGLRLYEFERCKGLFWQIDLYLPPASPFLFAHVSVANPNPLPASMYWWTNVAVDETPDVRVLAPARQAIYVNFARSGIGYGFTDLPGLPSLGGADGTYSVNSNFANEFFFQCDETNQPWEAALDKHGRGFVEVSTRRLSYRKLFAWGRHPGGQHWQEFLSRPGQAYLEIQAGLAPTQLHGLPMPAGAVWNWTQAFGCLDADSRKVHSPDWETAWQAADQAIRTALPPENLERIEEGYRSIAGLPPETLLSYGSGWGALEMTRREKDPGATAVPASLVFPASTLDEEQEKWLGLLKSGRLEEPSETDTPGAWMVQEEWKDILEKSLARAENQTWFGWLHLGVMKLENLDEAGAEAAWQASLRCKPSALAYRNLAVLAMRQFKTELALEYYQRAWKLTGTASNPDLVQSLAVEYLSVLCAGRQFTKATAILSELPDQVHDSDRIQILSGRVALETGDLETVEKVLQREYAVIREGEVELTNLWFEMWVKRLSAQTGRAEDEELRREVERLYPPPARIDFRSFND